MAKGVNPYKAAEEARKKAEEAKKKAQEGGQEPPKTEEVVVTPAEPEKPAEAKIGPAAEPEKAPEVAEEAPAAAPVDLLADLIPQKKKPRPETYGFYLDSDVHDELVKLAKANKTNKSRYLNALLRRVFFGE